MTTCGAIRITLGVVTVGIVACLVVVLGGGPVSAHVGLLASVPASGETVEGPVTEVTLSFTSSVELAGNGLEIRTGDGDTRKPDDARTEDDETWTFVFDEPLAAGPAGARWSMIPGDGHPVGGGFEFTISPASDPTVQAGAASSGTTQDSNERADDPNDPSATTPVAQGTETANAGLDGASFSDDASDGAPGRETVSALGNLVTLLGVAGAIGSAALAGLVLGTAHSSYEVVNRWIFAAALVVMAGAVLQFGSQTAAVAGGWSGLVSLAAWSETLTGSTSTAVLLRFFSGLAIVRNFRVEALTTRLALGLLALSFGFDGHSVTEGNPALHFISSALHAGAGAVWAGGIVALAAVLIRHRRAGTSAGAPRLAAHFATVAMAALVAVSVAGITMSALILDEPSQLWSTGWGGLLITKVAIVGATAATGAYNHFRLVPQLTAADEASGAVHDFTDRLRLLLIVEGSLLVVALTLTAFLIQTSPT